MTDNATIMINGSVNSTTISALTKSSFRGSSMACTYILEVDVDANIDITSLPTPDTLRLRDDDTLLFIRVNDSNTFKVVLNQSDGDADGFKFYNDEDVDTLINKGDSLYLRIANSEWLCINEIVSSGSSVSAATDTQIKNATDTDAYIKPSQLALGIEYNNAKGKFVKLTPTSDIHENTLVYRTNNSANNSKVYFNPGVGYEVPIGLARETVDEDDNEPSILVQMSGIIELRYSGMGNSGMLEFYQYDSEYTPSVGDIVHYIRTSEYSHQVGLVIDSTVATDDTAGKFLGTIIDVDEDETCITVFMPEITGLDAPGSSLVQPATDAAIKGESNSNAYIRPGKFDLAIQYNNRKNKKVLYTNKSSTTISEGSLVYNRYDTDTNTEILKYVDANHVPIGIALEDIETDAEGLVLLEGVYKFKFKDYGADDFNIFNDTLDIYTATAGNFLQYTITSDVTRISNKADENFLGQIVDVEGSSMTIFMPRITGIRRPPAFGTAANLIEGHDTILHYNADILREGVGYLDMINDLTVIPIGTISVDRIVNFSNVITHTYPRVTAGPLSTSSGIAGVTTSAITNNVVSSVRRRDIIALTGTSHELFYDAMPSAAGYYDLYLTVVSERAYFTVNYNSIPEDQKLNQLNNPIGELYQTGSDKITVFYDLDKHANACESYYEQDKTSHVTYLERRQRYFRGYNEHNQSHDAIITNWIEGKNINGRTVAYGCHGSVSQADSINSSKYTIGSKRVEYMFPSDLSHSGDGITKDRVLESNFSIHDTLYAYTEGAYIIFYFVIHKAILTGTNANINCVKLIDDDLDDNSYNDNTIHPTFCSAELEYWTSNTVLADNDPDYPQHTVAIGASDRKIPRLYNIGNASWTAFAVVRANSLDGINVANHRPTGHEGSIHNVISGSFRFNDVNNNSLGYQIATTLGESVNYTVRVKVTMFGQEVAILTRFGTITDTDGVLSIT